jgi:hypothetical protein
MLPSLCFGLEHFFAFLGRATIAISDTRNGAVATGTGRPSLRQLPMALFALSAIGFCIFL